MLIFFTVLIFVLLCLLGYISFNSSLRALREDMVFAVEFRVKYISFSNKYFSTYDRFENCAEIDKDLYVWLMKNVNRIQAEMGSLGVTEYINRSANLQIQNYRLILNTIPKFRSFSIVSDDAAAVDDCLLRYIGSLEEIIKRREIILKNPIECFTEGVSRLLSFPVLLLRSFGVLSSGFADMFVNSKFFKIFSNITSLVSFLYGVFKSGIYILSFFGWL